MWFVNTVNTKTLVFVALTYSTYISVHNSLNIQPIINPKKVLESSESVLTVLTVLALLAPFGS